MQLEGQRHPPSPSDRCLSSYQLTGQVTPRSSVSILCPYLVSVSDQYTVTDAKRPRAKLSGEELRRNNAKTLREVDCLHGGRTHTAFRLLNVMQGHPYSCRTQSVGEFSLCVLETLDGKFCAKSIVVREDIWGDACLARKR